jgi:hypothetical protein
MQPPWIRLHALWSAPGQAPHARSAATVFEEVDGDSSLLLVPGEGRPTPSDGWVPFALRNGHPTGPAVDLAAAKYLLAVRVFAADADRDEFRRWLDEEHCRLQVSLPGVNWFLGYEQIGPDHSFLNLWSLDDPAVASSEAWSRVRDTQWWARVAHVPSNADRGVFRIVNAPER